jgi:hypothetical protein
VNEKNMMNEQRAAAKRGRGREKRKRRSIHIY